MRSRAWRISATIASTSAIDPSKSVNSLPATSTRGRMLSAARLESLSEVGRSRIDMEEIGVGDQSGNRPGGTQLYTEGEGEGRESQSELMWKCPRTNAEIKPNLKRLLFPKGLRRAPLVNDKIR